MTVRALTQPGRASLPYLDRYSPDRPLVLECFRPRAHDSDKPVVILEMAWWMATYGVGFGFFQSPNNRMILASTPPDRAGSQWHSCRRAAGGADLRCRAGRPGPVSYLPPTSPRSNKTASFEQARQPLTASSAH
jgi:hypothetical protein